MTDPAPRHAAQADPGDRIFGAKSLEYRAVHPEGYAYSRFCQLFREFERRLSPVMR
jgi:hypothetical protein